MPGRKAGKIDPKKRKAPSPARVKKKEGAKIVRPKHTILIIDDEVAIQESLKEILTRKGHSVDTAGTGFEAIRMLNESDYDIIICDMKLPDMNTVDIYQQLNDRETALKKTIFISGSTRTEMIHTLFNIPRAHYLIKPFPPVDLYNKIDEIDGINSPPYISCS